MKVNVVVTGVACLLAGLAIPLVGWRSEALAQPEKQPKLEYRVVEFTGNEAAKHQEQLDKLAAEGWEYVGVLNTGNVVGASAAVKTSTVAFKRPRR